MAGLTHDVDAILECLGLGRWQITQFFIINFFLLTWAHMAYGIIIISFIPDFACLPPYAHFNEINETEYSENLTFGESCNWYDAALNTSGPCDGSYVYAEPKTASIVSEWDLVCGKTFLSDFSLTMLLVGQTVGTIIFTPLADKYGRKRVAICCHLALMFASIINCTVQSITTFIIARFFLGTFLIGTGMVLWVALLEMFAPKHRTIIAQITNTFWGFCTSSLAGLGYIMKGLSWRYVQLVMSSWSLIVIAQYFFVDESLRWLIANGREKEAIRTIWKAGRTNGLTSETIMSVLKKHFANKDEHLEKLVTTSTTEGVVDDVVKPEPLEPATSVSPMLMITHSKLRKITAIMLLAWFTNSLTYTGLYMLSTTMSGDRYMNLFLTAVVEVLSGFIMFPVLLKCGRRKVLALLHLLASISLISAAVIRLKTDGYVASIVLTCVILLGKFSITSTYNLIYMYTPELYPTNIRSFATGAVSIASRIAGFLAPFAATVAREVPWLPAAIFGGFCLLVAVLCPMLPETLNRDLPQTVSDLDTWDAPVKATSKKQSVMQKCI